MLRHKYGKRLIVAQLRLCFHFQKTLEKAFKAPILLYNILIFEGSAWNSFEAQPFFR